MRLIEAHKAIHKRVEPALDGLKLLDYLPAEQRPPFALMAGMEFSFADGMTTKLSTGYTVSQKIVIATKTREKFKAIQVMNKIIEALSNPLEIDGADVLRQFVTNGEVKEISDEDFYAELNFNLWLEDKENE